MSHVRKDSQIKQVFCQHHGDVGESDSWICSCRSDASGHVDKAQTEMRLEMMWCRYGCDAWETRSVHQVVRTTDTLQQRPLTPPSPPQDC